MPTYQYACKECGHRFETVQGFSDPSLTECPACNGVLRKVFNSVGVVFKGSGFYRNDSRNETKTKISSSTESKDVGSKDGAAKDGGSKDGGSKDSGTKDSGTKDGGTKESTTTKSTESSSRTSSNKSESSSSSSTSTTTKAAS